MNDIVVLTNDSRILHDALNGKMKNDDEYQHYEPLSYESNTLSQRGGLLGHVEQFKRSPDGLFLRISRKIWLTTGRSEMFLIKIGGNITGKFHILFCYIILISATYVNEFCILH